jgi:hypothetical protein
MAAAVALLAIGFPKATRLFWESGLERLRAFGGNAEAGVPLGHLLMADDTPVGVILTPASVRTRPDGTRQKIINLSSWYIHPDHRWRAPVMLRAVLRDQDAVYTDLTPSFEVQKLLPAFGFAPVNRGLRRLFTPFAALARRVFGRVRDLKKVPVEALAEPTRALLESHRAFDCMPCALQAEGAWHPLLFKSRSVRRLPAAELVYCDDHAVLERHLAAVARYLLRRGKLFLIVEDRTPSPGGTPPEPRHGVRYAKGGHDPDKTDYAGSEICILGV